MQAKQWGFDTALYDMKNKNFRGVYKYGQHNFSLVSGSFWSPWYYFALVRKQTATLNTTSKHASCKNG
ncbi:hypothetical protein AGIG_G17597 [Arapaima gigas]